jgi:alpha-L-fucosidase
MKTLRSILFAAALILAGGSLPAAEERPVFEANWESLNSRETPAWFRDAKFGIFIHWGVYSVPAICDKSTYSEWYWHWLRTKSHNGFVSDFHEKWYGKDFAYQDFAPQFRAELWNPQEWAQLFKRAGARYVVLVSKHHDGFALWPSTHASATRGYAWNSMEVGPQRDLCGELSRAVRAEDLKMGFYYSLLEWENPLYASDKARYVEEHMIPQMKDLVARYQPAVLWPDGEWDHPDTLWRSEETLAWFYNHVKNYEEFTVNDRWGHALRGQVGDYYTTEYGNIGAGSPGLKEGKPFEECRGIGHSFAFNRLENYDDYQTRESLVRMFIRLVSQGGNLLLNIGPDADGTIPVIMQDRLIAIGDWLEVNGEAIYGTREGLLSDLPWGVSTTRGRTLYLHVFDWPADDTLEVPGLLSTVSRARLLHGPGDHTLELAGNGTGELRINLQGYHPFSHASVIALEFDEDPQVAAPAPDHSEPAP